MREADALVQILGPLAEAAREMIVPAGQQIVYRTNEAVEVFCVVDGRVRQFLPVDHGGEQEFDELEPYSLFGHEAAFSGGRYHLSARAVTDSTLLVVTTEDLKRKVGEFPELGIRLLQVVAVQLHSADERVIGISLTRGRHRIKSAVSMP